MFAVSSPNEFLLLKVEMPDTEKIIFVWWIFIMSDQINFVLDGREFFDLSMALQFAVYRCLLGLASFCVGFCCNVQ